MTEQEKFDETMGSIVEEAKSTVAFYREHRATPGYSERIHKATNCNERDLGAVEQLMRDTFGTLDKLDARAFRSEAKKAFQAWQGFLLLAGEA